MSKQKMLQPDPDAPCQYCGVTEHKEPIRCDAYGKACPHCGGCHWGSSYCPYSLTRDEDYRTGVERRKGHTRLVVQDGKVVSEGKTVDQLRTELDAAHAKLAQMAAALQMAKQRWTFAQDQRHTHSWHDWADWIGVAESALDPDTARAGRLWAALNEYYDAQKGCDTVRMMAAAATVEAERKETKE